jgi:prolyl-tRNA synthetase
LPPFDVELVTLGKEGEPARMTADQLYDELRELGLDVLYDDRSLNAGEKFADAELLGLPLRLTVGRKSVEAGEIDVQVRRGQEKRSIPLEDGAEEAVELWQTLP